MRVGGSIATGVVAIVALSALACRAAPYPRADRAAEAADATPNAATSFLKGQLHAHTSASWDSHTSARDAAAWYAQHGFDFVVFTDHHRVTEVDAPPGLLVFRGVEITQNLRTCEPPPRKHEACLLHVNALFVSASAGWVLMGSPTSLGRVDLYGRAIDEALALGGIAQLNHPNYQGGADADVLFAAVRRGAKLVEIANQAVDSQNEGDAHRLSTEALWDAVLVRGAHVFGTATDDAHHYDDSASVRAGGSIAFTGDLGFVMVRAARTERSIESAIERGDFYASTGVYLERLEQSPSAIAIDAREDGLGAFVFDVIANGREVLRKEGPSLRLDPRRYGPGYVRVRVTNGTRHAWTQPVWL